MRLLTSFLLNVVGLGWTAITAAQPATKADRSYGSSTTCTEIPTSEGWGQVVVTMTEFVTVVVPSTVEVPTTIENTIYITDIEKTTDFVTITDTLQTTATDFVTKTIVTTAPIVLTVTTTSTLRITLCETRDVNPTYTAPLPIATDSTWGCPPGFLCKPPQMNCNFERGLPSPGYHCSPDQCVPAGALQPISFWGNPVTSNDSPLSNDTLFFEITADYFNMNPLSFDLSYDIFFEETVSTYTTTIYPPVATAASVSKRQSQIYVPAVCYDECNDAMLEAQIMGKVPALCRPQSAFSVTTSMCELCIQAHTTDDIAGFIEIQPQFQQFLNYCAKVGPPASTAVIAVTVVPEVTTLAVSEIVTYDSATYTFVIPTKTVTSGLETIYPSSDVVLSTTETVYAEPSFTSTVVFVTSQVVTTLSVRSARDPQVAVDTTLTSVTTSTPGSTVTPASPQFTGAAPRLKPHAGSWISCFGPLVLLVGNLLHI